MYTIFIDDKPINDLFSSSRTVSNPKLVLEIGKAGSLEFSIPSVNPISSEFIPLKTKVRVEIDGEELLDGRVLTKSKDFWNTRKITCEGNLAYLVDSVQKGEKFEGKTHDLFKQIISNHNKRVEEDKRFVVGTIGIENRDVYIAGQSDEIYEDLETNRFDYKQIAINGVTNSWPTSFDYIDSCLIQYCGGYLRTRKSNGQTYIDLILDYGNTNIPEIQFGVNLLDLTEETSIDELFTVLIPLGDNNLDISSVNDGSDELVDETGVARYGRIVKTHVFSGVSNAQTLLENGRRFLANQSNIPSTVSVKAIDIHFINPDVKSIHCGDRVHINSAPHGILDYMTCTRIEYDLENPENTVYTFGIPHQTLTDRYRKDKKQKTDGSGGGGAAGGASSEETQEKLDKFYDAWINVSPETANVNLGAVYKELQDTKTVLEQQVGIDLNAVTGNVNIKALRQDTDTLSGKVTDNASQINILANETQSSISLLTGWSTKLEETQAAHYAELILKADELESSIKLKADTITLEGIETTINSHLEGIDATLLLKADADTVTDLAGTVTTLSTAQSELATRVGAAESSLSQKAESSTVTALDGRVSTVESATSSLTSRVGDAEASLTLKASQSDLTGLSNSFATLNADWINFSDTAYINGHGLQVNGSVMATNYVFATRELATPGVITVGTTSFEPNTITTVTSFTQALGEQAETKKIVILANTVKTETTVEALPGEVISFVA